MGGFLSRITIALFVDSIWLHKYWGCHRMPERSFFVNGRQFHVCARCTGLLIGAPCSLLLIPFSRFVPILFAAFVLVLAVDALTQLAHLRVSTNPLRFITGFGTSVTFLPTLLALVRTT